MDEKHVREEEDAREKYIACQHLFEETIEDARPAYRQLLSLLKREYDACVDVLEARNLETTTLKGNIQATINRDETYEHHCRRIKQLQQRVTELEVNSQQLQQSIIQPIKAEISEEEIVPEKPPPPDPDLYRKARAAARNIIDYFVARRDAIPRLKKLEENFVQLTEELGHVHDEMGKKETLAKELNKRVVLRDALLEEVNGLREEIKNIEILQDMCIDYDSLMALPINKKTFAIRIATNTIPYFIPRRKSSMIEIDSFDQLAITSEK